MLKRIVSMAPSNTEILFELGLDEEIVAVTRYCDFPEKAKEKPKIGGWLDIKEDLVLKYKPDLLLTSTFVQNDITKRYKKLGMNIETLMPTTLVGVFNNDGSGLCRKILGFFQSQVGVDFTKSLNDSDGIGTSVFQDYGEGRLFFSRGGISGGCMSGLVCIGASGTAPCAARLTVVAPSSAAPEARRKFRLLFILLSMVQWPPPSAGAAVRSALPGAAIAPGERPLMARCSVASAIQKSRCASIALMTALTCCRDSASNSNTLISMPL